MAETGEKKEKKPVPFRIQEETAEKIREISKGFPNQDSAFNALMGAFERENLMMEQPQFAEDIKQFEQYQRLLSLKFTDALNALSTADERARAEVQNLLLSKDLTIQSLQEQIAVIKADKDKNEKLYADCLEEKRVLEENLSKEKLASQGLESQMRDKEQQFAAALNDKERLNDVLTKNVKEKQDEVERLQKYAEEIGELQKKMDDLAAGKREAEQKLKEAQYHEQMVLLEREKQFEQEKAALRREIEEKAQKQLEKNDKEIEKLRELLAQAQERIIGAGKKNT